MAVLQKPNRAVLLLAALVFLVAVRTGAAQNDLINEASAGDLPRVKALRAVNADGNAKMAHGKTVLVITSLAALCRLAFVNDRFV